MTLLFTNDFLFRHLIRWTKISLVTLLFLNISHAAFAQAGIWRDVESSSMTGQGKNYIVPSKFRALSFDMAALKSYLANAPVEAENGNYAKNFYFTLPMPDGTNQRFYIVESSVMAPELAAKFPGIKTFGGQGIDDPTATLRMDYTQFGFHAQVLSAHGSFYIDPYFWMETEYYISYDKKDYQPRYPMPMCETKPDETIDKSLEKQELGNKYEPNYNPVVQKSIGTQLRKYDLALACTGEYAATYGGTTSGALAGMTTSINRVDGIYEREVCVRLVLVANTNLLIYTNSITDPYTNNNGGTMLSQNQTTVTSIIGTANYDIGHVFSTGGGGIAGLGVVCNSTQKARGVTGLPQPVGDAFDVDYVAHEMGHQFGGNHTFNCETGSCSGNRAFTAAYEPGSGSTIMAYAGICPPNDLQPHSDAMFSVKSFDEITVFTMTGTGNACATTTATGNNPPVINAGANYIIPDSTAFILTGSATDPDGDTLTYSWEEFDLGSACNWNAPIGNSATFRAFAPTTNPWRIFPKLSVILANSYGANKGELMVDYARTLKFKLTCRDNKFGGGGVTNNDVPVTVQVVAGAPFKITYPNTNSPVISYNAGTLQTITWDVAGSDAGSVNTPFVDIYLSTDGGLNFTQPLGTHVPNNGSYQWWVPAIATTTARIRVMGEGNIFFDINDKNFTLTGTVGVDENAFSNSISIYPNPGNDQFNFAMDNAFIGNVQVLVFDKLGRVVSNQSIDKNANRFNSKLDLNKLESGMYTVEFIFDQDKAVKRLIKL